MAKIFKKMSNVENNKHLDDDLLQLLEDFQKFEEDYESGKEEIKELKAKLLRADDEVKAARDMEKSHRDNLTTTNKIIADLQSSLSHYIGLKSEVIKMVKENKKKDSIILDKEQDIAKLKEKQNEEFVNLKKSYEQKIEQVKLECESKISNFEHEMDTAVALAMCQVGELNNNIKKMEDDSTERINMMVVDYEEKLLKAHAQITQFRDEHSAVVNRSNTNIEVYQKKIADVAEKIKERDEIIKGLEEKLKESQFKQCKDILVHLSNNCQTQQYTNYPQSENHHFQRNLDKDTNKNKRNAKNTNAFNPLNIIRKESKGSDAFSCENAPENRTGFNIVKKRKLFNNTVEGNF